MRRRLASSIFLLLSAGLQPPTLVSAQDDTSAYDDIWGLVQWYDNEDNATIQSLAFTGRFQYEYATLSETGVSHDEWNVRRMRLGLEAELFREWTLHAELEVNPQEADPFYTRLTDAYVEWSRSDALALTVGKQGVPFTMDGSTSSRSLLTIDRSNLSNNMWFPQEYLPGLSASGVSSGWSYRIGAYSSGARNREFGEFNGSGVGALSLGYDLSDRAGTEVASLTGNYVYQSPHPNNSFTRQLQHVVSVNFDFDAGRWGLRTDVTGASGYGGQSDLWGTMVMPFFDLTSRLQLVGRHTYLASSDPNGVRFARYESQAIDGRGDSYNEGYLGLNYYFYGHLLKLQAGLTIADMKDEADDGGAYSGVGLTTGLRIGW